MILKRKMCFLPAGLAILLCMTFMLYLPVLAAEKGYPYDDPDLYYYNSREYNGEKLFQGTGTFKISGDDSSSAISELGVQIWSELNPTKGDLLQQDLYVTNVSGLPTEETSKKAEKQVMKDEEYTYIKSAVLFTPPSQELRSNMLGSPQQFMTYVHSRNTKNQSDGNYEYTAEETTFAGYPAVITRNYGEEAMKSGGYSIQCHGSIFLYVTDMPIPPALFIQDTFLDDQTLTDKKQYEKLGPCYAALEIGYEYTGSTYGVSENQAFLETKAREVFNASENDFNSLYNSYDKSITFNTKKTTDIKVNNKKPGSVHESVDTDADSKSGETALPIPEALAIAILGGAAALLGAGSGGNDSVSKEKKKSRYQMRFKKDFGDNIIAGGKPVPVYARIVEITPEGNEIDRPDLSSMLTFNSSDFEISGVITSGGYQQAMISAPKQAKNSGVLSISFSSDEGSFTNNITFRITGEPYIEYSGHKGTNQMYILGGSGRKFTMDCKAVDFPQPPIISVKGSYTEFSVEIEPLGENNYRIFVTDNSQKPENIEQLKKGFDVELSAVCEDETYTSSFTVIQCFEGMAADFWGKTKEIRGYKDENNEMAKTLIGFSLGIWNESEGILDEIAPQDVEIHFEDELDIYKIIGMKISLDENSTLKHITTFVFQAETPYPSLTSVKGTLTATSKEYSYKSDMTLIPDIQQYSENFEKEFEACKKVIEVFMPPEYRKSKLESLALNRYLLGVEDLKIYRREIWDFAHDCIIKERDSYLNEALWWDRAITAAEVLSFIGDIAFDLALAPIGGPITGFLAGQVKSMVTEYVIMIQEQPEKSISDIGWELIQNRLVQTIGSADGAFDMPDLKKPKELAVWLTCYSVYRLAYHWQFDKDDAGNSIGICESIKRMMLDLTGKGAGALLGDYVNKTAKGRWPEKISIKEADEKLTKEIVGGTTNAMREGTEKLVDSATEIVQNTTSYVTDILSKYLEKLKSGIF